MLRMLTWQQKKKLRTRLVNKTVTEFNEITTKIKEMKDELSLQVDQLKSMQDKIKQWALNIGKMEGRQGVLRMRLLELGVDVATLQKSGPALEGIHFTSKVTTSAPTATVSRPEDLGEPVTLDLPTTTVEADIHPIPTSSVVDTVANPSVSLVSTVDTVSATSGSSITGAEQASTSSTSAAGQLIPLSAAQISQLITPGGAAVGGPQQIINVGGQNVLISGSGPGSIGSSSVHYGKILKGTHKYFCPRCKRPFTQKESLTRHMAENCPQATEKKKYKCDSCGSERFSSKQYLKKHLHQEHLKTPCYFCRACRKGFFKHCNLSFHKKSCLQHLAPSTQQTTPQANPVGPTPPPPPADDTSTERQGDPLIGG